jgi:hypothetical protein
VTGSLAGRLLGALAFAGLPACLPTSHHGGGTIEAVDGGGEMRFEALRALVANRGVRTVDELVPRLPVGLRSRHVVVYESRSIQSATFTRPRVLLFTRDAKFVVAFNGRPEGGEETVETMEFDDRRRDFRFREIAFGDPRGEGAPVLSEGVPRPGSSSDLGLVSDLAGRVRRAGARPGRTR